MLEVLREYIEDEYRIIEYTKDGVTVSHIVKTGLEEPGGETLPVPPNPIEELQAENATLLLNQAKQEQQIQQLESDIADLLLLVAQGGK